jgi:hypothetical protein
MNAAPPPKITRPKMVPKAVGLNCPGCGAGMALRTFSNAVNVVCPGCGSVLDATDARLQVLQGASNKKQITPLIPLGTRGKWKGNTYEVVGFQRRTTSISGGAQFHWFEYLLFNPYAGYRYFTEYEGHWNDVTVCRALPKPLSNTLKPKVQMGDRTFTHFQSATATTTYILGEFPWQVRRDDKAQAKDFISPPFMLSAETTDQETTWSLGEYTAGKDIWQAFNLPGKAPNAEGVFANQPSPYGEKPKSIWHAAVKLIGAALLVLIAMHVIAANRKVFSDSYVFSQASGQESSFVTPVFELGGHPSNVEVRITSDLSNNWTYFNFALINEQTGQAYDFGRELSYYYGRDSDGSWTEGGTTDTATIPTVPLGHYYLRVEPEMAQGATPVHYTLSVYRDVPSFSFFLIAAVLLLVPPAVLSGRALKFEYKRWQESDYAVSSGDSSDDD